MHFQYLVEDQSGAALIRILMQKIVELYPNATYDCKGFRGIGGFTRKNTIKETKTGKLLNDLATYLRGFDRSLQSFPSVIIVVLDSDDHDVQQFRSELEAVAMQNMIKIDHVFCLAVEEIEAWLLGDRHALLSAYPHAKMHVLNTYVQDSICGTWEVLADAVYPYKITYALRNFQHVDDVFDGISVRLDMPAQIYAESMPPLLKSES